MTVAFAAPMSACGESADAYTVVYHLNYSGAERTERESVVPAGAKAVSWMPVRDGYSVEGWFTDPDCQNEYDFNSAVRGDLDLYAAWSEQNTYTVTFDSNFSSGDVIHVQVDGGDTIADRLIPEVSRLGREFNGWYRDAECTLVWNFETDTVTSDTVLYAGYTLDGTVPRDANGNIVYEDVIVNVWIGSNFNSFPVFQQLAEEFNAQREGEITVRVTTQLESQGAFSLRFQHTPEKSLNESTYYSAEDVYDLAGITFDKDNWYEQASRDSMFMGEMTSIPIVGGVPYFIYNKSLMQKYNGDNPLPSDYSEFSALLKKAYEGESASNPSFRSVMCAYQVWGWREAASYAAFAQNEADYWVYEDGHYVNKWNTEDGSFENAVTAFQNTYDLFGENGACHGGAATSFETDVISAVSSGNALAGMVTIPGTNISSDLGIMPLSGLFTDLESEQAGHIPIHTIGLAFYRASDITLTDLAAAAEFAEYVSRNSYAFAETGWYPLRRSVVESGRFQNSDNSAVRLLRQVGAPENFRSLDGKTDGKMLVNEVASGTYILPALGSGVDSAEEYIRSLMNQLKSSMY